ncbi:hypothetical protein MLD38_012891 [Melastoma candidum]|uniref:Uncharacterized protein n=1 Tax=Melastoma candidum TaxID=119954 RepID=A0ACB9R8D7_9MYRT|nr:hypothetical protein MLD38_012891 [Melastoma candidum]
MVEAVICVAEMALLVWTPPLSFAHPGWGSPWGGGSSGLPEYYMHTCPQANDIVLSVLERAFVTEPRIAASLLRLHFHDCFVQGCDA